MRDCKTMPSEIMAGSDSPVGTSAWAVWDAKYEREIPVMHCQCCKNRGPPTCFQNPKQLGKALAKGNVLTAPDIDTLARRMAVLVGFFRATMER